MNFDEFLKEWKNDKEYILALSSGSTGKPKNILLPKSFVKKSAGRTNDFFQLSPGSILHSCVGADLLEER